MKPDEDVMHDLLVRVAPDFDPLDPAALRAEAPQRKQRGRALVAVAAAVLVVIAIAVVLARRTPGEHRTAAARTASTKPTVTQRPGPKPAPFRLELRLPGTRFPADGTEIHAEVLVINHIGRTISVSSCNPWLSAGLSAHNVIFDGVRSLGMLCNRRPAIELREGVTRIPVSILTTYTDCAQGKQPGSLTSPHCIGPNDDLFPNLRPGRYRVELATLGVSPAPGLPRPVWITLLPR